MALRWELWRWETCCDTIMRYQELSIRFLSFKTICGVAIIRSGVTLPMI